MSDARSKAVQVIYQRLSLGGEAFAVLPEDVLIRICHSSSLVPTFAHAERATDALADADELGGMAARLVRRRRSAGLTQRELAHRAGVRPETLNRIERGRTTPDFATIRKLVTAMQEVEGSRSVS